MDPFLVILTLIAVFVILGFLRGLVREVILTLFILGAITIMTNRFDSLVAWVNRLYRMTMFVLKGGIAAENPVAVWENVKKLSPLVETAQERLVFQVAMMGAALIAGYIVGNLTSRQRLAPVSLSLLWRPADLIPRLLGAIGGAVNGYLVINYLLPKVLTEPTTVIIVPTAKVSDVLQINMTNVAIAILVIIIIIGLQASGSRSR